MGSRPRTSPFLLAQLGMEGKERDRPEQRENGDPAKVAYVIYELHIVNIAYIEYINYPKVGLENSQRTLPGRFTPPVHQRPKASLSPSITYKNVLVLASIVSLFCSLF